MCACVQGPSWSDFHFYNNWLQIVILFINRCSFQGTALQSALSADGMFGTEPSIHRHNMFLFFAADSQEKKSGKSDVRYFYSHQILL